MLIPPPSTPLSVKDFHLTDWTVVVNSERAFQVNSTALASNSRYFYDAFTAQQVGAESQKCSLSRVTRLEYPDVEAVKDLLDFVVKVSSSSEPLPETELVDLLAVDRLKSRLTVAKFFGVPRMIDAIVSSAQRGITCTNCWEILTIAADPKVCFGLLEAIVLEYITRHFCTATEQPSFVSSASYEQLRGLLQSDYVNAPSELHLLSVISGWTEADEPARLKYFPRLLSLLRLGRLDAAQLGRISTSNLARKMSAETGAILGLAATASANPFQLLLTEQTDPAILREMLLSRLPHQAAFLCGGWEGNIQETSITPSSVVQLFDPISSSWNRHDTFLPAMDTRHAYSACVELRNIVYLIGGYVTSKVATTETADSQGPTARVRAYSLRQNVWRERAPMHEARNFVSACKCQDRLYAMGGHNGNQRLSSAETYNTEDNRWSPVASMLNIRSDASAASLNGLVYICGGFSGTRFLATAEQYNPEVDQWTMLAPLTTGRSGLSVCAFDKYIYALGGNNGTVRLASVERYDPDTNVWAEVAPMLMQRSNFCSCILYDYLYVFGGWSDQTRTTVRTVERCKTDGAWELTVELELPNSACSCCAISDCYLIEPLLSSERHAYYLRADPGGIA